MAGVEFGGDAEREGLERPAVADVGPGQHRDRERAEAFGEKVLDQLGGPQSWNVPVTMPATPSR